MNATNKYNNKAQDTIKIKRVGGRYTVINEDIFNALDIYERSVYLALRFEADFGSDESAVKRSIAHLAEKAKMSERKVNDVLNTLEFNHFLIQRHQSRFRSINTYLVAQDLNYFKPVIVNDEQPAQDLTSCAQDAERNAQHAQRNAPCAYDPLFFPLLLSLTTNQAPINDQNQVIEQDLSFVDFSDEDKKIMERLKTLPQSDKSLVQLFKEVRHNIKKNFPNNFMYGLNGSISLISKGNWVTPKGFIDQDAINAEKATIKARQDAQEKLNLAHSEKMRLKTLKEFCERRGEIPPMECFA